MAHPASRTARQAVKSPPPLPPSLPLAADHWAAIFLEMKLSPRQTLIVELVLHDKSNTQIAQTLKLGVSTIKTQLERIFARTGTARPAAATKRG
jgi:DNA-binding NarL/FixJ family response regulator